MYTNNKNNNKGKYNEKQNAWQASAVECNNQTGNLQQQRNCASSTTATQQKQQQWSKNQKQKQKSKKVEVKHNLIRK